MLVAEASEKQAAASDGMRCTASATTAAPRRAAPCSHCRRSFLAVREPPTMHSRDCHRSYPYMQLPHAVYWAQVYRRIIAVALGT